MLVVSPRGVHCRFWSHVGRLGRRVTILTHSGISQGFTYERIYKNLECSLDITGSDCCKRYFPGIGFYNRKKKNIHVLNSCQKIFLRRINRNGSENKLSINKQKKLSLESEHVFTVSGSVAQRALCGGETQGLLRTCDFIGLQCHVRMKPNLFCRRK